ncbi:MAG: transporter [Chitinophagales bacterium]
MQILKLLTVIFFIFFVQEAYSQGCVAIRGNSSCSAMQGSSFNLMKGEFLSQTGLRHFKSFRHFRGATEETNRVEDGTEVINRSYFLDLSLSYGITDRLFANVVLPFVFHNRSSMYEHGGNPPNGLGERHETASKGLSDMRLGLGYWLLKPNSRQFNYSVGLGIKLPTGKYDYTDTFYNQGENRDENIESVVDQSIQPGDGGTGLTVEMQGYHSLSHAFMITANVFYLFNYQDTNGVLTRNGRSEFSCPDQFGLRAGVNYTSMYGFNAYLGARMEGVPSDDLIGNSSGYRRPGYVVSVEPGIGYFKNNYSLNLNVPIAVKRNRTQSYEDKERTIQTGVYQHGDAAFADYLLNVSFSYRFGGHHKLPENSNIN